MQYHAVVTGGTGFIGRHLVQALLLRGWTVNLLVSGNVCEYSKINYVDGVKWFGSSDDDLDEALVSATHFFNFAVLYDRSTVSDVSLRAVNVELPLRILRKLDSLGGQVTCILGDTFFRKFPISATQQSRYTRSKCELASDLIAMCKKLDPGALRVAMLQIEQVYGPGEAFTKVLPNIARQMLEHAPIIALTHGRQLRDFIHVADVITAILCIADSEWHGLQVVQCGTGFPTPLRDVLQELRILTKSTSILGFGNLPSNQTIDSSFANIEWLSHQGWSPQISLKDGLCDFVSDIQNRLLAN